ncbi:hypothetical protein AVEN_177521-1, partial [Araneus ventricosus]
MIEAIPQHLLDCVALVYDDLLKRPDFVLDVMKANDLMDLIRLRSEELVCTTLEALLVSELTSRHCRYRSQLWLGKKSGSIPEFPRTLSQSVIIHILVTLPPVSIYTAAGNNLRRGFVERLCPNMNEF